MILKKILKKIINNVDPTDKYIWFESNENFFDNSYALFSYIKTYRKHYHLFYRCFNYEKAHDKKLLKIKGIKRKQIIYFEKNSNSIKNKFAFLKYLYLRKKCGLVFISYNTADFKEEYNPKQKIINLWHANLGFKNGAGMDYLLPYPKNYYYVSPTKKSYELETIINPNLIDVQQIVSGKPRNDYVYEEKRGFLEKFLNLDFSKEKFILICTTFKTFTRELDSKEFLLKECPFNFIEKEFFTLNEYLKDNNLYLVIKSHHVQDKINGSPFDNLSNVIFKTQRDFEYNNLHINHLFRYSSGLITDISSIYFDYLLVNKPVGFYDSYFDEYKGLGKLTSDSLLSLRYGYSIKTFEDMIHFLNEIIENKNHFKENQKQLSIEINGKYQSNNCRHLCETLNIK